MASQPGSGSSGSRASGRSGGRSTSQRSAEPAPGRDLQSEGEPRTIGESSLGGLSAVSFLTVAEVASLMRVSKMTVYRLLHSGELAGVRVGRSFRVPESAVHSYLRDAFNDTA